MGLIVNAHFSAVEKQTVLTLPKLNHPIFIVIGEENTDIVILHEDIRSNDIVEFAESEIILPAVPVVGVIIVVNITVLITENLMLREIILNQIASCYNINHKFARERFAVHNGSCDNSGFARLDSLNNAVCGDCRNACVRGFPIDCRLFFNPRNGCGHLYRFADRYGHALARNNKSIRRSIGFTALLGLNLLTVCLCEKAFNCADNRRFNARKLLKRRRTCRF